MFHPYNVARHLSSMSQQRDNLDGTESKPSSEIQSLVGIPIVGVIVLFILLVIVWIWALAVLLKHWDSLHSLAKFFAILDVRISVFSSRKLIFLLRNKRYC